MTGAHTIVTSRRRRCCYIQQQQDDLSSSLEVRYIAGCWAGRSVGVLVDVVAAAAAAAVAILPSASTLVKIVRSEGIAARAERVGGNERSEWAAS